MARKLINKNQIRTVGDILAADGINGAINELIESKAEIRNLLCVWTDEDGDLSWILPNLPKSQLIGYLEIAKLYIMMTGEGNG